MQPFSRHITEWIGRVRQSNSPTPVHDSEHRSGLARFPWIEAIAASAGPLVFYFVLHNNFMAEFFAVLGALLTLSRLGVSGEVQATVRELKRPFDKLTEYVDLSMKVRFPVFHDLLDVYVKITEEEFSPLKNSIIEDAGVSLRRIANDKRSEVLSTTEYYSWLLPMVESAVPPTGILALSMMRQPEWDDSPPERRFIEGMTAAAERGVRIDRVFVMPKAVIVEALRIPAVAVHQHDSEPRHLLGYIVEEEQLRSVDPALFGRLGDGFIVFGDRVALIDVFSPEGARGFVTMSHAEIESLRSIHRRLLILAEKVGRPKDPAEDPTKGS